MALAQRQRWRLARQRSGGGNPFNGLMSCLEPAARENFGIKTCKKHLEQDFWQEKLLDRTTPDSFDLYSYVEFARMTHAQKIARSTRSLPEVLMHVLKKHLPAPTNETEQ